MMSPSIQEIPNRLVGSDCTYTCLHPARFANCVMSGHIIIALVRDSLAKELMTGPKDFVFPITPLFPRRKRGETKLVILCGTSHGRWCVLSTYLATFKVNSSCGISYNVDSIDAHMNRSCARLLQQL